MVFYPRKACGFERAKRRGMDLGSLDLQVPIDRDRAFIAMPRPLTEVGIGLDLPQIREHVGEPPTGIATSFPLVEVTRLSAEREPGDRGSAAHELDPPQVSDDLELIGLGGVAPVEFGGHVPAIADGFRWVRPEVGAGFEQDDRSRARCSEARRHHAAGRAGADDHHVDLRTTPHGGHQSELEVSASFCAASSCGASSWGASSDGSAGWVSRPA